jgi:uncharacterized RDD family membrane protein YckC
VNEPGGARAASGYAGIVTRTVALAADALVLNVGIAIATTIVGLALSVFGPRLTDLETPALVAALCSWTFVAAVYFVAFWALAGQTPGMRVLRLEVSCADGGRVHPARGLLRLVGMVLAALPLFAGYLLILWDPRRQGLHDKLAGTVVRYAPRMEASAPSRGLTLHA